MLTGCSHLTLSLHILQEFICRQERNKDAGKYIVSHFNLYTYLKAMIFINVCNLTHTKPKIIFHRQSARYIEG